MYVGGRLRVSDVKPYHIENWIAANYSHVTGNTENGIIKTIQRALSWGFRMQRIPQNPLQHVEKPSRYPRETFLNEEQFQKLLGLVEAPEFKDYLCFLWETGCRPQEIKLIEARHGDGNKIILERSNSKGKRYNRVIYLNEAAKDIFDRLSLHNTSGPVFRNTDGIPWTANSVNCRFRRLKDPMGMPGLCATTLRHSWATNTLRNGMDSTTASILMGHRDPSTLIKNYQHLTKDHDYLEQAAQNARQAITLETDTIQNLPDAQA